MVTARARKSVLLFLASLLPVGCAEKELVPLPQRTVLYYDYVGAWAATAGNECEERVDLSDGVFIAIAPDPSGERGRFYAEYFFVLDPQERAQASVGQMAADGSLTLSIDSHGTVDGRQAAISYTLGFEPKNFSHILLTRFDRTVRDATGTDEVSTIDLLQDPTATQTVPVLAAASAEGLCLRRM